MTRPQTLVYVTLVIASLSGGVLAVSCSQTGGEAGKEATPAAAAEWTPEQKIAEGEHLVAITGWITPAGTA